MSGMKIGNYKNSGSTPDIVLGATLEGEGADIPPVAPEAVAPVEITPPAATPPAEPVPAAVGSTEPATISALVPAATQPAAPAPSTEPITPPANVTEPKPVVQDTELLTILSEKLGRPVSSFDELNKQPENPLDSNPQLKQIAEWSAKTGRPLTDWVNYQKDYDKMSDLEVVRESLRHEYPTLSPEEVQLELEGYIAGEDDMPNEAAKKTLELKKKAMSGRATLNSLKLQLDTPLPLNLSPELQQDLEVAKVAKANLQAQKQYQGEYSAGIKTAASTIESIPLQLEDGLVINYAVSAEDKQLLPDMIATMPHWRNADGTDNHAAVVRDAAIIKNLESIVKIAYQQGIDKGKLAVVEESNNISFDRTAAGGNATVEKGIEIEGLDAMLGRAKTTVKFGGR